MCRSKKPYWFTTIAAIIVLNFTIPPGLDYSALTMEALGIALVGVSVGYTVQMIFNRLGG
jgi:hypothetical protein